MPLKMLKKSEEAELGKLIREGSQSEKETAKKKLSEAADKCRDKITSLQSELEETEKNIEETTSELLQKEAQLKKAEYSPSLQKLDDAALSKLSARQAELLAAHILSGKINALLEEDNVDTSNNE